MGVWVFWLVMVWCLGLDCDALITVVGGSYDIFWWFSCVGSVWCAFLPVARVLGFDCDWFGRFLGLVGLGGRFGVSG